MRGQRGKQQDWSKPFKMVFSKAEFDELQTSEDTVINIQAKQPTTIVKQQIITPLIETVKRHTQVKPFAKINPNYIRLASHLNVPKTNDYELTQIDHVFIQTHRQKYKCNGKIVLSPQFLKNVIIALQSKQGKDQSIPRSKNSLVTFIDKQFKQITKMQNYENFTDLLYNYWRNRREELKFPLYRPLWRPNHDEYNHLLAFKFREKQKRSLRRSSRTSEDDIVEEMANELGMSLKIAQRVQLRQQLKQKQVQVQMSLFHLQLKSVFAPPDFLVEVSTQNRNKDKEKTKKFGQDLQKIRKQRQIKNEQVKQPQPTIFDQKQSVVNFLATVVAQAQLCGLSYQRLFHYKSEPLVPVMPVIGSPLKQLPIEVQEQQYLNLSLARAGDYIIRKFQQEQSEMQDSSHEQMSQQINPINRQMQRQNFDDLFDFKKRLVTRFYFGEDDQGQYQNLRKNISANFKKFQSVKEGL